MISDAHEGIEASVAKVMSATWRRCRVHFGRNVLTQAGRSGRRPARTPQRAIERRTEAVDILPDEAAITRLVGAILLEQNDE